MNKALATLLLTLALGWICGTAQADALKTWRGGTGIWEDPDKWDPRGVPGPEDAVLISPEAAPFTITVTTPGEKSLQELVVRDAGENNGVTIKADGVRAFDVEFTVRGEGIYIGTHNGVVGADGNAAAGHPDGGSAVLTVTDAHKLCWNCGAVRGGRGADGRPGTPAGGEGGEVKLTGGACNDGLAEGGRGGDGIGAGAGGGGGRALLNGDSSAANEGTLKGGDGGDGGATGGSGGCGGYAHVQGTTAVATNRGVVQGGNGGDGRGGGDGGIGGSATLNGNRTQNLGPTATLQGGRGGRAGVGADGGRGGYAGMDSRDGGWENEGVERGGAGGTPGGAGGACANTGRNRVPARAGAMVAGNGGELDWIGPQGDAKARADGGVLLIGPYAGGGAVADDRLSGNLVVVRADPAGEIKLDGLATYAIQANTAVHLIAGPGGAIVLEHMTPGTVVINAPQVYACGRVHEPTLRGLCSPGAMIHISDPNDPNDPVCRPPPNRDLGDMNCDGVVNFEDINPFVLALTDMLEYMRKYPGCDWLNGDINDDGWVDADDINPFVRLLAGR